METKDILLELRRKKNMTQEEFAEKIYERWSAGC